MTFTAQSRHYLLGIRRRRLPVDPVDAASTAERGGRPPRGTGLREWCEVRHGGQTSYCATAAELQWLLHRHGLDLGTFVAVDSIDDGCE